MSWVIFFGIWAILILLICLFVYGASLVSGFDDDDEENNSKNHG